MFGGGDLGTLRIKGNVLFGKIVFIPIAKSSSAGSVEMVDIVKFVAPRHKKRST